MIGPSRYKVWEAEARRPCGGGALHPDLCEKLTLRDVDFAVQPLRPGKGVRFRPNFSGGEVALHVDVPGAVPETELLELADGIRAQGPIREGEVCPACGKPDHGVLEIDLDTQQAFLCKLVDYAARLLRKQYALTDEQLGELFAFDGERLPEWMGQVIRHAYGLNTQGAPIPPESSSGGWDDLPDGASPPPAERQAGPEVRAKRPWWRLGK